MTERLIQLRVVNSGSFFYMVTTGEMITQTLFLTVGAIHYFSAERVIGKEWQLRSLLDALFTEYTALAEDCCPMCKPRETD